MASMSEVPVSVQTNPPQPRVVHEVEAAARRTKRPVGPGQAHGRGSDLGPRVGWADAGAEVRRVRVDNVPGS